MAREPEAQDQLKHDDPPPPPEVPARLRIRPGQLIGMLLIALVPALALTGLFGTSFAVTSAQSPQLRLEVKYPERFRHKITQTLETRITNTTAAPLEQVVVSFDPTYLAAFSNVQFTPQAERAYEVELRDIQPGETRLIRVELEAESYWNNRGSVTASHASESASVQVSTFILP